MDSTSATQFASDMVMLPLSVVRCASLQLMSDRAQGTLDGDLMTLLRSDSADVVLDDDCLNIAVLDTM